MFITWSVFLACTLLILVSGTRISKYGDVIATKTGLGGTWVGILLLATVTSLPEAITGFSGIVIFDVPEIALGGIFGSCMFNLLIIAALEPTSRSEPILSRVSLGHIISASFGVILIGTAAAGILAADTVPSIGWVSLTSITILVLYLFGMRTIFGYERQIAPDGAELAHLMENADSSLKRAYIIFVLNAVLIVGAAVVLPGVGEEIAIQTGLAQSFVGSFFIALSTSLPEVVVAVTAVRIGAIDLAIAGLLGSNLFNIAILAVADFLYVRNSIYIDTAEIHAFTAVTAIVMSGIAILGLMVRPRKKPPLVDWDALAMIVIYAGAVTILFSVT